VGIRIDEARVPWRTLSLAAVALVAAAFPGSLELLELNREAVAGGQVWRLLTCHLVHGSSYHLSLDLAAWVIAGFLFEPVLGRKLWPVLIVSALLVDTGFLFLLTDLSAYCGLSGVLNGLMAAGLISRLQQARQVGDGRLALFQIVLLVGILGKIVLEGLGTGPIFSDIARLGSTPVPLAHACGALGGSTYTIRRLIY
jgi:rhomboid family GlyGly-CTERM serine protease